MMDFQTLCHQLEAGEIRVAEKVGGQWEVNAWIKEANGLGMTVNVWTVNNVSDMLNFIAKGVSLITTDKPVEGLELLSKPFVTEE